MVYALLKKTQILGGIVNEKRYHVIFYYIYSLLHQCWHILLNASSLSSHADRATRLDDLSFLDENQSEEYFIHSMFILITQVSDLKAKIDESRFLRYTETT